MIQIFRKLRGNSSGNVAILAALAAIPLVAAGGLAIDYTRALQFKTSLQGACDSAALAGASLLTTSTSSASTMATDYIQSEVTKLPPNKGVTYTVTTPGSNTVNVTATGKVATTFMSIFTPSFSVTTAATAGPSQGSGSSLGTDMTITFSAGGFNSSAADANTIYWYIVPKDGSVPPASALNPLFTNDPKNPVPAPSSSGYTVGATQQIGFALQNVTGGITNYGSNQYGGTVGSVHMFYSHLNPPSSVAYPGEGQDNLKVCTSGTQSNCESHGSTATPTTGAPTCTSIGSNTEIQAWNDMGGNPDDLDYNDAVYQFSCSSTNSSSGTSCSGYFSHCSGSGGSSSSNTSGVVLIK
jgi:Flp pilus assembly protein TadG